MTDRDVERDWSEFWAPVIYEAAMENAKGCQVMATTQIGTRVTMDLEVFQQIKRELFDWHQAMTTVSSVYSHATGGMLSKPTYSDVRQITGIIDEYYAEAAKDDVTDMLLDLPSVFQADADTPPTAESMASLEDVTEYVMQCFEIGADELTDAHKRRESVRAMVAKASLNPDADPES